MFYVYNLKQINSDHYYVGYSTDLRRRLNQHSSNLTISTRSRKWLLNSYFAFSNRKIAEDFKRYLKSGSGRVFSKNIFKFSC